MFPEPTELLLIGCSIESIWTLGSESNTLTSKNQLADMLTMGNFTRNEWNHLLCLFNISHFSSTNCSEVMSKRTKKIRWRKSHSKIEADDEFGLAMERKESWTTQSGMLTKNGLLKRGNLDEVLEVRTERPVNEQPPGLFAQHTDRFIVDDDDMDSNTVAESDMSLKSRSFLHRVKDRVRKMLDQSSKDATQDSNKHLLIWRNVYVFDITSICFQGKGIFRKFTLHQKYREQSRNETDVWHMWKVDSRTIRWDFWSDYN